MIPSNKALQGLNPVAGAEGPEDGAGGSAAVGAASPTHPSSEGKPAPHARLTLCSPGSTRPVHACLQIVH